MYQNENLHRCLLSLHNYQNQPFFSYFSDLTTQKQFFQIIEIYMGFPYISEAVFSFLPKC